MRVGRGSARPWFPTNGYFRVGEHAGVEAGPVPGPAHLGFAVLLTREQALLVWAVRFVGSPLVVLVTQATVSTDRPNRAIRVNAGGALTGCGSGRLRRCPHRSLID